jgi:hypothetical protein
VCVCVRVRVRVRACVLGWGGGRDGEMKSERPVCVLRG